MESTQIVLNVLIIGLIFALAILMFFDFCAGLINLWSYKSNKSNSLSSKSNTEMNHTLSNLKPVTKVARINAIQDNSIDTESLEELIQNLPQSRIRTAARRLGIGDKINGKYQKLAVLRTKIQTKLKTQPQQVEIILNEIADTSKSKVAAS
ncbi:MAG: hypothetical protein QNJ36_06715 [Calothrix sp. MO_167.B42]|nr:hypothetical protein [Calothrix sp. MO_167.B42]